MREQETLQDGLDAARPAIDQLVSVVSRLLIELRDNVESAAGEINAEILAEHDTMLDYHSYLRMRQGEIIHLLQLVDNARRGSSDSYQKFLSESYLAEAAGAEGAEPSRQTLDEFEQALMERTNIPMPSLCSKTKRKTYNSTFQDNL